MNLRKFIELKKKLDDIEKKCTIQTLKTEDYYPSTHCRITRDIYYNQLSIGDKNVDFVTTCEICEEWKSYQKINAINKITNVLGEIDVLEYVMYESYLRNISDALNFDNKDFVEILENIIELSGDTCEFQEPLDSFIKKKQEELTNIKNESFPSTNELIEMQDRKKYFYFEGDKELDSVTKRFLYSILKKRIEQEEKHNYSSKQVILARIMSEGELKVFQENGLVAPFDYTGKRYWDDNNDYFNSNTKKGNYTFMVLDSRKNILLNCGSVLPHIRDRLKDDSYIVFFQCDADEILDKSYYGDYDGKVRVDEFDSPGIYGRDQSVEVAFPYYSDKSFKLVMYSKTDWETLIDDFFKSASELKLLNTEQDENTIESVLYNDFRNWFEGEQELYDNIANLLLPDENIMTEAFKDYIYEKKEESNKYFDTLLESSSKEIDEELRICMQKIKNDYNVDYENIINTEMYILQKLLFWEYDPIVDYDYEYDNDNDDYEYDDDTSNETEKTHISEDEIVQTVMDPEINRETGNKILTYCIGELETFKKAVKKIEEDLEI